MINTLRTSCVGGNNLIIYCLNYSTFNIFRLSSFGGHLFKNKCGNIKFWCSGVQTFRIVSQISINENCICQNFQNMRLLYILYVMYLHNRIQISHNVKCKLTVFLCLQFSQQGKIYVEPLREMSWRWIFQKKTADHEAGCPSPPLCLNS